MHSYKSGSLYPFHGFTCSERDDRLFFVSTAAVRNCDPVHYANVSIGRVFGAKKDMTIDDVTQQVNLLMNNIHHGIPHLSVIEIDLSTAHKLFKVLTTYDQQYFLMFRIADETLRQEWRK